MPVGLTGVHELRDEARAHRILVRHGRAVAPDRAGPGRIADAARHDMDVQLRHQIAQRADIDLGRRGERFQRSRGAGRSPRSGGARSDAARIEQLDHRGAPRYQDQPAIARIVHQQHARQRPVGDEGVSAARRGCRVKSAIALLAGVESNITHPAENGVRIGIIGCGIAGQAAAIGLARDGHDVTVVERFAAARPVGAGLLLQPSGLQVLERLGARDEAERWGAPIQELDGGTPRGRRVLDLNYGALHGLGIHRAALFNLLHERLGPSGAKAAARFRCRRNREPPGTGSCREERRARRAVRSRARLRRRPRHDARRPGRAAEGAALSLGLPVVRRAGPRRRVDAAPAPNL